MVKCHECFERLISGNYDSLNAIAQEEKVDSSNVTRLIYFAFMNPFIFQRILKENQCEELNANRQMRIVPPPAVGIEQKALFGIER
jgi:hypothetical protein